MSLKVTGVNIFNVDRVAYLPHNADFELSNSTITNAGTVIEVRDPPSLMSSLGLPPTLPPELLLEVLRIYKGSASKPKNERIASIAESPFFRWLGPAAKITKVWGSLAQLQSSGGLDALISYLSTL